MTDPGVGLLVSSHLVTSNSFFPSRIIDQRFEKVAYFVFGDFNFRLDSKSVVEVRMQLPPYSLVLCFYLLFRSEKIVERMVFFPGDFHDIIFTDYIF